jgi:hypothetical protein
MHYLARNSLLAPLLVSMTPVSMLLSFWVTNLFWISSIWGAEPLDMFLERHCLRCHSEKKEESDVRLDQLSRRGS